jgi:hypothetical protein
MPTVAQQMPLQVLPLVGTLALAKQHVQTTHLSVVVMVVVWPLQLIVQLVKHVPILNSLLYVQMDHVEMPPHLVQKFMNADQSTLHVMLHKATLLQLLLIVIHHSVVLMVHVVNH